MKSVSHKETNPIRFHLHEVFSSQNHEDKVKQLLPRDGRRGEWQMLSNGYSFSFIRDEELSGWIMVMVAQQCEMYVNTTELYIFKPLRFLCVFYHKKKVLKSFHRITYHLLNITLYSLHC